MTEFIRLLELFNTLTEQSGTRITMKEIKKKEEELNITLPKKIAEFYLVVGHNKKILDTVLLELDKIHMKDNQLVIGKYKKGKVFGVIVNEVKFYEIGQVIYYDNNRWHPDILNLTNTLIMLASTNVIYDMKYIAEIKLPKEFRNHKEKVIEQLMPDFDNCELIRVKSCGLFIHTNHNCLAWYMRGTNKLLIGSKEEEQLMNLIQDKQLTINHTIIDGVKMKEKK